MANDIHPKGIHGGDQYGTTITKSNAAISFPTKQVIPGYGTRIKATKPYGGTQYGTTLHDSMPYRNFPNPNIPFRNGSVVQKGSAMRVDSEKVIVSSYKAGINVKNFNGSTFKTATQAGPGGPTDRKYPLGTHYPLVNKGSNMKPANFQDN